MVTGIWSTGYKLIYYSNAILEGLKSSTSLTPQMKAQLQGEALFMRAYIHFQLTNYFGKIPYVTTTDYLINAGVVRAPVEEVYAKIVADLTEAIQLLPETYVTTGRVRPNKFAATALLARVFLYQGEWSKAEAEATKVIGTHNLYTLVPPAQVFLSTSQEAIWQVMPVTVNFGADDAFLFLPSPPNSVNYASLRPGLVEAFEENDGRRTHWVGSVSNATTTFYFSAKYKVRNPSGSWPEYNMMLRLAEQYLLRAEARAQQGNLEGAKADLDVIRSRAGLPGTQATNQSELLQAIEHERRVELFAENGHRWFDLIRTGKADAVLVNVKPDWQATDSLYPVPQSELLTNARLLPQNPGY